MSKVPTKILHWVLFETRPQVDAQAKKGRACNVDVVGASIVAPVNSGKVVLFV